jgi:hypothetical protein
VSIEKLVLNIDSVFQRHFQDEADLRDHFLPEEVPRLALGLLGVRRYLRETVAQRLDELCLEIEGGDVMRADMTDALMVSLQVAFSGGPRSNILRAIEVFHKKASLYLTADSVGNERTQRTLTAVFVNSLLEVLAPAYRPTRHRLDSQESPPES